ncbi:MAG: hypothetical protein WBZ33_02355 [Thermoactinomyces sp.]
MAMPQASLNSAQSITSRLPAVKVSLIWIAAIAFVVLGIFVYGHGWQKELLYVIGFLLGVAFMPDLVLPPHSANFYR